VWFSSLRYTVTVNGGYSHSDLYGEIVYARGRTSYVIAPPSYDATDGPNDVPVPATLALLRMGVFGACGGAAGREGTVTDPIAWGQVLHVTMKRSFAAQSTAVTAACQDLRSSHDVEA